jgi:hypothetical protein
MRFFKVVAPAVLTGLLAASALASLINLDGFWVMNSSQSSITLCADAPFEAAGKIATVYEGTTPVTTLALLPGPNLITVPNLHTKTITIAGPEIAAKTIFPGIN